MEEIVWTQERVAHLNWEQFKFQISQSKVPIFYAYAADDHIIQVSRAQDLRHLIERNTSVSGNLKNTVQEFTDGGHNIQKTKVDEICKAVVAWLGPELARRTSDDR